MVSFEVGRPQPDALFLGELGQCHGVDGPCALDGPIGCAGLGIGQPGVLLVLLLDTVSNDGLAVD